jgi:membrane protease YdiL (CAAX protease family)
VAGPSTPPPPPPPSHPIRSAIRPSANVEPIDVGTAVGTFFAAWVIAQFASFTVLAALGGTEDLDSLSIPVLAAGLLTTWAVYVGSMWWASRRAGSGHFRADYRVEFRSIDAIGLGIGVLCQLVIVNLVYLPLRAIWPDTFSDDRVQETAQDLVDRATGANTVLLLVLVIVGAPVVEELFYRGLLQGSLAARFNDGVVLVAVAAVFALIHFRPVEYPGLFAFGLVLGACALWTGRLGMPIAAHVGFNATGIVLVL